MSHKFEYTSVLAPYIRSFVEMKLAQGYTYYSPQWMLKEIDDFYNENHIEEATITKEIYRRWLETRIFDGGGRKYSKAVMWRTLATYMRLCGVKCEIPMPPRPQKPEHKPYVLTHDQMTRMFTAIDSMEQQCRNYNTSLFSMPALFRFIYATGVRENESISLINSDVDLDNSVALIRNTKNRRDRYVPISDSLKSVLEQYITQRDKLPIRGCNMPNAPFFVKANGKPITPENVYDWFRKAMDKCGIPYYGDRFGPVVHSLRHTYAVHAFVKSEGEGLPLNTSLPIIQTCMGHKSPEATEHYIRLTHEMYPQLITKAEMQSINIFPEISDDQEITD